MRVVIISKTFVAATAQRQLEWLARQPNVDLTLITPPEWRSDDGRLLPFAPHFVAGYAVRQLPVFFNGRYHFYVYRGLGHTLRELQPDLVHIDEEPYNPAGLQAQRAADTIKARTIFVAWQNLYREYPFPFARFEQYNYRRAAHVIAGAGAVAEVVRRKGYTGPISTFSVHGVDPDIYAPAAPYETRVRATDAPFTVGYIGRLVLYKGIGALIEAISGLPARFRLRIIGSGPDEGALRALAQTSGVAERIEFLPAIPTGDIPQALAGLDALALPSLTQPNWKEQFGRILIEAMACETPVIGSDSGEIPNVIGDAGLVTPEGNVAALRSAITRLADEPQLHAEYALAGRRRVLEHFTQEQVARKIAAVYTAARSANFN